jgi:hypothetical protein
MDHSIRAEPEDLRTAQLLFFLFLFLFFLFLYFLFLYFLFLCFLFRFL